MRFRLKYISKIILWTSYWLLTACVNFLGTSSRLISNFFRRSYKLLINPLGTVLQTTQCLSYELLMNFLWNFLWTSYELLMDFLWTSYELLRNFLWTTYELLMNNFLWTTSYELLMNFLWTTSYELLRNFLGTS